MALEEHPMCMHQEPLPACEQVWRPAVQASDQVLQTRIVHLPMAFNDMWTNDSIAKYMKSVRLSGLGPGWHKCCSARASCADMLPSCHDEVGAAVWPGPRLA